MYNKTELRAIFQAPYDENKWKPILRNFFHADELRPTPQDLGEEDGNQGYYLGCGKTEQGLKVGFFYYRISKGHVLRKRVGLRKLITPYVTMDLDAAVAVFEDDKHWRLSFISDFKGVTTAPKRFTYVFGETTQYYNTPVNRLFDLKDKELTLENLYDAFSVEALSEEFFHKYKEQYEKFCNYLYKHRNNANYFGTEFSQWDEKLLRDYVKKMMGRLVFLQFVQKKGWLGDNANYLRAKFSNYTCQDDFLDQVLEPLFFGVFNTQPADRLARFQQEGWNSDLLKEWKDVPFLSGGLFDEDKLDVPNSKFPASYFKELFDFFAGFNFTIDENDPNDAEIGVDPEMLGKIFENLLEDNKDKGAYYTPKEIVHYMSCESIIQYLKTHTDETLHADIETLVNHSEIAENSRLREGKTAKEISRLLKEVKVCDPAIGSGAFPMGVLNVIYNCRRALHEANSIEDFKTVAVKKEIIQNNIYGVDIEQGAVDIARLRFWLALLVDAQEPEALPNLTYKIMRGNSLIPTFDDQYLDLSIQGNDEKKYALQKELYTLQSSFYNKIGDDKLLTEIRIKQIILQIVSYQIGKEIRIWEQKHLKDGELFHERTFAELKEILPIEKAAAMDKGKAIRQRLEDESLSLQERANTDLNFFDWKIMFSDVFEQKGGFDIVIGNPPYVQLQKSLGFKKQNKKGQFVDVKLGDLYNTNGFETFERTGDLYCLFYEQGYNLLRPNGNLCFITSNKWMRAGYGSPTREFFTTKTNPILLIDFAGVKIFENATVDTNILLFSKSPNEGKTKCVLTSKNDNNCLDNLSDFVKHNNSVISYSGCDNWIILSPIEQSIKRKIELVGTPLKDWGVQINYGIKTGFNDAFIITTEKRNEILFNCKDADEHERTEQLIRPILRGRDIKRYCYTWSNLWIIATFPSRHYEIDDYPAVKQHLLSFGKERLEQSGKEYFFDGQKVKSRKKTNNKWYEVQDSISYWDDFSKPKVIYPETTQGAYFAYDESGMLLDKTCFMLISSDAKYIQITLSSSLFEFAYKKMFSSVELGNQGYQYNKHALIKVPILHPSKLSNPLISEDCTDIDNEIFAYYHLSDIEKKYVLDAVSEY